MCTIAAMGEGGERRGEEEMMAAQLLFTGESTREERNDGGTTSIYRIVEGKCVAAVRVEGRDCRCGGGRG